LSLNDITFKDEMFSASKDETLLKTSIVDMDIKVSVIQEPGREGKHSR
jgi:hypothetical protein